jgi:hypothetical protein
MNRSLLSSIWQPIKIKNNQMNMRPTKVYTLVVVALPAREPQGFFGQLITHLKSLFAK